MPQHTTPRSPSSLPQYDPRVKVALPTPPEPHWDWMIEFRAFSMQHVITVAIIAALMAGAAWLGRRWRGTPRERTLRYAWIVTTVLWQAAAVVWWLLPANFDPRESFPLHLCDLAAWVAPFALLTQARWLRTLLYFWAFALSTQAYFTPVLDQGFGTLRFWLFFVGHTHIVGSAVYDVVALGYRPMLRDWLLASGLSLAYGAVVLLINLSFDLNYGYLGRSTPEHRTLLDALGPWPWRPIALVLIAQAALVFAYLPWPIARRIARTRGTVAG